MIVVDTNVLSHLYLAGNRSDQADAALLRDPLWAAPLLWRSEFRNVLSLYVRRNILALQDAQQIMDAAIELMRGREYEVVSARVLSLAAASGCSAYDCEFVALAEDLDLFLVTCDRQILDQFPSRAVALDSFVGP